MKPVFKINNVDFTEWVAEEGLSPVDNDLDSDGSGRNLVDGLMYRSRVATKEKWAIKFLDLPSATESKLLKTLYSGGDYVKITAVDAQTNKSLTKTYYFSSVTKGAQVYRDGDIWYKGCTLNITER